MRSSDTIEAFVLAEVGAEYLSARRSRRELVLDACERLNAFAIGSWRRGDFHLARSAMFSESDVDAVELGANHHTESELAVVAGDTVCRYRLSVHPQDYEAGLSLEGQRLLALLNVTAASASIRASPYQLAKAYLTLHKQAADESYLDAAGHAGSDGLYALRCKLGILNTLPTSAYRTINEFVTRCLRATSSQSRMATKASDMRSLRTLLDEPSSEMSDYFRAYLADKFG